MNILEKWQESKQHLICLLKILFPASKKHSELFLSSPSKKQSILIVKLSNHYRKKFYAINHMPCSRAVRWSYAFAITVRRHTVLS